MPRLRAGIHISHLVHAGGRSELGRPRCVFGSGQSVNSSVELRGWSADNGNQESLFSLPSNTTCWTSVPGRHTVDRASREVGVSRTIDVRQAVQMIPQCAAAHDMEFFRRTRITAGSGQNVADRNLESRIVQRGPDFSQ
jgi:hypothetical protein